MKKYLIVIGVVIAASVPARAEDNDVMQIKQSFVPSSMEVKVGAVVNFLNADDVNHNLYSVSPAGARVDYGVQKPGETAKLAFDSAGVYTVMCNIHPKMKMKVAAQ